MINSLAPAFAIFEKELKIELRNRRSIYSLMLYCLAAVLSISFALANQEITVQVASGLIWAVLFLSAGNSIARSFIYEEETNNFLLLKSHFSPFAIYFGKFTYNTIISLGLNIFTVALFLFTVGANFIINLPIFALSLFSASIAVSSSSTLISAIIARASAKNSLFPILALPLFLPIVFIGAELFSLSLGAKGDPLFAINALLAYSFALFFGSIILIDFVYSE